MAKALFELNPDLDRKRLAEIFADRKRIQVRDFLTRQTAEEIRTILSRGTRWGLAMQADGSAFSGPQQVLPSDMQTEAGQKRAQQVANATHEASAKGEYAFRYAQFSLVQNLQEQWNPGGPHELLLEYLNAPDFLDFAREVTGIAELHKADGQATLYSHQHFLHRHDDSHVAEGWRVAYVMNFTIGDWHPNWGGYLQFYDEDGDIEQGYMPRFNSLNMFMVPQPHAVSFVPPFAPVGRFAITGWLRDR